tara:strand:- start:19 stop:858 length:840 start_codon:yes stop_codon:yes gene_type:complete
MQEMEDGAMGVYAAAEEFLVLYGMSVIGALVMLIVGWWLAGRLAAVTTRALNRVPNMDATLKPFLASLVKYAVLAITIIAVLNQFGVETTSIIALLGAAGLAIGLALQGTLQNVAAGVMLLLFRPFKVGDFVDAEGISGSITTINLFTTEMNTPDGVHRVVPNSMLWGRSLLNFSHNPTRRVDLVLGIGYGDDIDKAQASIMELIGADTRVLAEPAAQSMVTNLGESSVDITFRVWVNAGDYWGVLFDLTKASKQRLDRDGISIPFPQRDVHLYNVAAE